MTKILELTQLAGVDLDANVTWLIVDVAGTPNATKRLKVSDLPAAGTMPPPVYNVGNFGAAPDIDWPNGCVQRGVLNANATFNFRTPPTQHCLLILQLTQDATGSRTVTWPTLLGDTPLVSSAANSVTVVMIYYDGANYHVLG